ncbi:MAG: hypothetical protein D6760_02970, partial [Deltaproteobacteria bacterium]
MATAIVMPRLGMTMKEGTVIEWRAAVGDSVAKGDVILLIESEKAEAEIEAPISGVLRHIYVEPERTVPSGTLLAAMTETADEPFDAGVFEAEYLATDERARGLPGAGGAAAGQVASGSSGTAAGQAQAREGGKTVGAAGGPSGSGQAGKAADTERPAAESDEAAPPERAAAGGLPASGGVRPDAPAKA